MSIKGYIKQILSAKYGKDVRQSIADALNQCYEDAQTGGADITYDDDTMIIDKKGEGGASSSYLLDSDPAHSTMTKKQLAVLDNSGKLYGAAVNIDDVMIKPRNTASGSIGVFDGRGNLIPTSFDSNTPLITLANLLIKKEFEHSDNSLYLLLMNDIQVECGIVSVNLNSLSQAENMYRQNVTVNKAFKNPFTENPIVLFGPPTDMDASCFVGASSVSKDKIDRLSVFSHQANAVTATIPYIAIGYRSVNI